MCFLLANWVFPLMCTAVVFKWGDCTTLGVAPKSTLMLNVSTIAFRYQNKLQCRRHEFYDLDHFACAPCEEDSANIARLQSSEDKFSCHCPDTYISVYEYSKTWPTCVHFCLKSAATTTTETPPLAAVAEQVDACFAAGPASGIDRCIYRYINTTTAAPLTGAVFPSGSMLLTNMNSAVNASDCHSCDPVYNFVYQHYCIANSLLRPYLHYNAFWQSPTSYSSVGSHHFSELKFVAFFCLAMHNATACNQLANLCVLSHYSLDKHSPCSAFLLTQVSDVVMKYASAAQQLRALQPFLFYRKGKLTSKLLTTPLQQQPYSLQSDLALYSTTYSLAGSLKRLGSFSLQHVNLCQLHGASSATTSLRFAHQHQDISCQLTLEQLIDLARLQANENFISIYLNYTHSDARVYMQPVPVLIETLSPENQRSHTDDWQLVKRFQLIEAHPKERFVNLAAMLAANDAAPYEDGYKLQLYRALRYVRQLEFHYDIHAGNRIAVPLLKLRYHHIELSGNASLSLQQLYPFQLRVSFQRVHAGSHRQLLLDVALPLLLLCALAAASLRLQNQRRRRRLPSELCDSVNLLEFLRHLANNVALALLLTALLLLLFNTLEFFSQRTVEITLPLIKHSRSLDMLIYLGCLLQLGFLLTHLRHASQLELFLIDWERPREQQHLNLKSNLETSSVCSSVRTYVAESNVSAWRVLFTANEWIRLSGAQKYSSVWQAFVLIGTYYWVDQPQLTHNDVGLRCGLVASIYLASYLLQLLVRCLLLDRLLGGDPLRKFIDLCSLSNISFFGLLDADFGYYIHGRSPHGFADTDMCSMIMQLQREAQQLCGRRGLLMDSDKQAYIMLPPRNLRIYLERLLIPFQRSCSISQMLYQKEVPTIDGTVERTSIAYASVNRFFCAFIDHAIKDMDYIIKEKTLLEKLLNCEMDNYVTETKGTFYIDDALSFGRVLLLGNHVHIFALELLILLSIFLLTGGLMAAAVTASACNLLLRGIFRYWVRRNVSLKTQIDQRFLL